MPWCGPWFMFPFIGLLVMVLVLFLVFGPSGPFAHGRRWWDERDHARGASRESALDILKRRYASGEITKDEYETMRRDVS